MLADDVITACVVKQRVTQLHQRLGSEQHGQLVLHPRVCVHAKRHHWYNRRKGDGHRDERIPICIPERILLTAGATLTSSRHSYVAA